MAIKAQAPIVPVAVSGGAIGDAEGQLARAAGDGGRAHRRAGRNGRLCRSTIAIS